MTGPDDGARLRVGLLLDPRARSWAMRSLRQWCAERPDIELVPLAPEPARVGSAPGRSGGSTAGFPGPVSRSLFRLLARIEGRLIGSVSREPAPISEDGPSGPDASAVRIGGGDGACERISRLGLDLIVSFGPSRWSETMVGSTRLGGVSVEHEGEFDDSLETGGFWPVLQRAATTGFTITVRTGDGGDPIVLRQGSVRNRFSYLHNQIALHKKSLHSLLGVLVETAALGRVPAGVRPSPTPGHPHRGPTIAEQLAYFGRFLRAAVGRVLGERGIGKAPRWRVHFAPVDWRRLDMAQAMAIENPRNGFLADPFVVEEDGRTFCFAEELVFRENRGCIAAYELSASGARRIGRVIEEPFHMSFPYLFRYRGALYMLPETSGNRDIRVYRCVGMPGRWELAKVLMTDLSSADTMVFEHDGRWWMLTNLDPAETGDFCSELHVFHADDPLSDRWSPHPMNPVVTDARRARNGGLLIDSGTIYRVSQQQGFDTYGSGFDVNRIDVLTPEAYAETRVSEDVAGLFRGSERVHHVHSNGRFTVFDRCRLENVRT